MRISECRICKNKKLHKIGSLGRIAISDFTLKKNNGIRSPLELVYCDSCTLLQLAHNPPRHKMYKNHYWYESGLNPAIIKDLESIVKDALKELKHVKNATWIDIGANDGTLLSFVPKEFNRIGIEPAPNLKESLKKHADKIIQNYFDKTNISKKADIITAIAMFYDLPNPNMFTRKLKEALSENGIAIIQLMTLAPMLEQNDVGNICHEHIEYYSYKSLVTLLENHGLEIYKASINSMNGGSYRLFIRHKQKGSIQFKEKSYALSDFKKFFNNIEKNKRDFIEFIAKSKKSGKKIVAYGASTKGNTILQYYGVNDTDIPFAVDINPEKKGRHMIRSNIKIVDTIPECDYLWVLPYAFVDFFKSKEKEFIKRGGKFIISTPKFKIL